MTKTKRFSMLASCLLLMLALALTLSACGKGKGDDTTAPATTAAPTTTAPVTTGHQHVYTTTVVSPTCTAEGYTTHSCTCGHSYNDTVTPVLPHDTVSKIIRYPSTMTEGLRRFDCVDCDHAYTEDIEVVTTFVLPSLADALAASLPKGEFSIDASESIFVFEQHVETMQDGNVTSTSDTDTTYAMKVATLDLAVTGSVVGELELALGTLDEEDVFDAYFTLGFFINGEEISFTVNGGDEEERLLSDTVYDALAEMLGMPREALTELAFQMKELSDYMPIANAIAEALSSAELPEAQLDLLALLGSEIFSTEAETEGSVTTVTTTVDLGKAVTYLGTYADKTVADILDDVYGEGTATALFTYLAALPDMKVSEVANAAIAAAETYEIDLDMIYALINRTVYLSTSTDFDIESAILSAYDKTLAEVVVELSGEGTLLTPAAVKAAIGAATLTLAQDSLADLYHDAACPIEGEGVHEKADCTALADALAYAEAMAGATLSLTMVETYTTVENEGEETSTERALVSLELLTPVLSLTLGEEGDVLAALSLSGYTVVFARTADGEIALTVEDPSDTVLKVKAEKEEGTGAILGYTVTGYGPAKIEEGDEPAEEAPYGVVFIYYVTNEDFVFTVYDVTDDPETLEDTDIVATLVMNGTQFSLAIWTPYAPATGDIPAFGLGYMQDPTGRIGIMLAVKPSAESAGIDLRLTAGPDSEGYRIVLATSGEGGGELANVLIVPGEGGEFTVTAAAMGSTFEFTKEIEGSTVSYTLLCDDTAIASLVLTPAGTTLAFPLEAFPITGTVATDKSAEENVYTYTVSFDGLELSLNTYDSEEIKNESDPEAEPILVETTTSTRYMLDGDIVFTYTAPAAE